MSCTRAETGQSVSLLGYSLGGYLALTAAMTTRDIAAVAVCYGGVPTPFAGLAANLPPTLILHGSADPVIPVSEARSLSKLLRRHRIPHEVHIRRRAGMASVRWMPRIAVARVVEFFHKHRRMSGWSKPSSAIWP